MKFAERRLGDHEPLRDVYIGFAFAVLDDIARPDTAFTTGLLSAFLCLAGDPFPAPFGYRIPGSGKPR